MKKWTEVEEETQKRYSERNDEFRGFKTERGRTKCDSTQNRPAREIFKEDREDLVPMSIIACNDGNNVAK